MTTVPRLERVLAGLGIGDEASIELLVPGILIAPAWLRDLVVMNNSRDFDRDDRFLDDSLTSLTNM